MTITVIDNESGEAYERVVLRQPRRGDTYLGNSGEVWTPERPSTGSLPRPGYRHILKPISNEYVRRSEVDVLVSAAEEFDKTLLGVVHGDDTPVATREIAQLFRTYFAKTAAALEPFQSPPEVQERWRWEGDSIFDGDTEFNIANVEGCTELVAALNANEQPTGD